MNVNLYSKMRWSSYLFLLIISIISYTKEPDSTICITNEITRGRLGDNIIQYVKTKWFAYTYGLTFYFQPFKEANLLKVSQLEPTYTRNVARTLARQVCISHESEINNKRAPNTLFIVKPYAKGFYFQTEDFINYLLLYGNQEFINDIKEKLTPINCGEIQLPSCAGIRVAMHIRRPSGGDYPLFSVQQYDSSIYKISDKFLSLTEYKDEKIHFPIKSQGRPYKMPGKTPLLGVYTDVHDGPLKFPPIQYYIDVLNALSAYLDHMPLDVVVFTDDSDPLALIKTLQKNINNESVSFKLYHPEWKKHIVEDLYLMSKFDCLIKSESTFSSISQLLGNHAITVIPSDYMWEGNKLIITERTWMLRAHEVQSLKPTGAHYFK